MANLGGSVIFHKASATARPWAADCTSTIGAHPSLSAPSSTSMAPASITVHAGFEDVRAMLSLIRADRDADVEGIEAGDQGADARSRAAASRTASPADPDVAEKEDTPNFWKAFQHLAAQPVVRTELARNIMKCRNSALGEPRVGTVQPVR
jgi:hypothetical protein